MDTSKLCHRKSKLIFARVVALVAILTIAFPVTAVSYAAPISPFIGNWEATDVDGSDMTLSIAGNPQGIFQLTWTDNYIAFCNGAAGLVRGTGRLNESNPNVLEADLHLACFITDTSLDFHLAFRYHPATNTLSLRYDFGQVTIWHRPDKPLPPPPALNLRVNYGHDWVESFYEGGHTAWVTVTDSDGNLKATAELVTEPKDFWGGETGFQSGPGDWLDAEGNPMDSPPDIQPGDWVLGWVDNGAAAQVQIGDISGKIDLADNSISGTITAPWFTETVQVECLDWFQQPPSANKDGGFIAPDGAASYACSWPQAEWDIQPGQTVGVGYLGPDGNWVSNAFTAPFPRIVASEAGDWFWVTEFYPGTLDLFIYESADKANLLWSGQAEATDLWGITFVGRDVHGQDLVPGNYVVVSDGVNEKGVVLETIAMEVFNVDTEIMAGTAPKGREVSAAAGPQEWQERITVQADPLTGMWLADFGSIGFDITEDMRPWSFAQIFDEDGDANEAGAPPPQATIFVTGTGDGISDDGTCTLREAIIAANTNSPSGNMEGECPAGLDERTDTIVLAAGSTYSLSIDRNEDTPADGDLDIHDNSAAIDLVIWVEGEGKATISQDAASVDDRVLENHEATVQIENLILTGGGNVGGGGGLANNGTMDVIASEVRGNSVGWDGGGIRNAGVMTIDSSTISNNSSSVHGGGVMNWGTLTVKNSKITGNTSVHNGGGINSAGTLTVDGSVLQANTSGAGGALYNSGAATIANGTLVGGELPEEANIGVPDPDGGGSGGGGLFNLGTLTVNDSTVTGNQAGYGGGLFNWTDGMLTVSHSTVSNNQANEGGGLHNKEGSTAVIQNGSIFSGNSAEWGGGGIDNWGAITITGSVLRENTSPGPGGDAIASGVFAASTASITGSCIVGNGDIAVFSVPAALTDLNAIGNWWGDVSGPTHWSNPGGTGDSVSDGVVFSPWLDAPPDVCAP